jgi:CMP-N,N'-diacetyllegionaminic acid synthase
MNVAAIILARGGSKGIPKKNIIDFCGKPLIAWSIEQAAFCESISSVWVSSDSEEILSISERYGAQSILRPKELSADSSTSESGWLHAIDVIEGRVDSVDLVVAMQATSPLREPSDIEGGIRQFVSAECDSLFSAGLVEDFCLWVKNENGELDSLNFDFRNRKRRQENKEQFVENGSFYIFRPELLRSTGNRLGGRISISVMDFWKSFEIDSVDGLEMCTALMKHFLMGEDRR